MSEETNLTHSALSLIRKGNTMQVWKIRFNPETKEVGTPEVLATEDDQKAGEERFKICVVSEKILS